MPTVFPAADDFPLAFAAGYLAADRGPVGTEHLLYGATAHGSAKEVLAAHELTQGAVRTVLRSHVWARADHGDPFAAAGDTLIAVGGKPVPFTTAAAAALRRCTAAAPGERGPADVVVAALQDEYCRAVELVALCGADPAAVRRDLSQGAAGPVDDRVPPELRATRDALIGRRRYRSRSLRSRFARVPDNYGEAPGRWVRAEAEAHAARHGGRLRSDDIVLALLAVQEVADRYPHLARGPGHAGGRALTAAGARYADALRVVREHDLGADAERPGASWPTDTADVLRGVLAGPGGRAVRLLGVLGIDPASVRA